MLHPKTRVSLQGLALLCLATFALAGCSSLQKLPEKPSVSVSDVQLKKASLLENVVLVSLRVMNPNDAGLDIKGITCDLALNGKEFAQSTTTNAFRLEPNGSVDVPVEIRSATADALGALTHTLQLGLKGKPAASYTLKGTMTVNFHGLPIKVPFSKTGEMPLGI